MVEITLKYWTDIDNVGDLFSRDVAERYIGPVTAQATGEPYGSTNVMLIGSLMLWCDPHTIVCGSGIISPDIPPTHAPRKIISVRGPKTREELLKVGINAPARYGDPGLLAGDFVSSDVAVTHRYGVIMHHEDARYQKLFQKNRWFKRDDTQYIDVANRPRDLFRAVQQCETILSSSLHGIIFAHALGKPALWVRCGELVGAEFKFHDYYNSVGVASQDVDCHLVSGRQDLDALARRARCIDVGPFLPIVREALEETRNYLEEDSRNSQTTRVGQ